MWYNFFILNKKLFNKKEVVAVALSGGADSVCLLHLLHTHAEELDITVKAINVEHGIRGEASLKDSEFASSLCRLLNVELKSYSVNTPLLSEQKGYSMEQAARVLRYECFDNALIGGFCDKIATAHHSNDNAETVLFNLLRGSALEGVCGIDEISQNGKIIRPILNCTRAQIKNYVTANNLPFTHDESNDNVDYTRNFLRKEVFPLIESRFENAQGALNNFARLARRDEMLLDSLADSLIDGNSVKLTDELHLPLFTRACLKIIKKLGITKDFESVHLDAIYNLRLSQTGKRVMLKKGVVAYKSKERIVFEIEKEQEDYCFEFKLGTVFESENYIFSFEKTNRKERGFLCFDGDKLPYNAIIRTKRTGDAILTFGGGRKSLKKFLNDKKIDARISKHMPLIATDEEILAICPVDISKKLAIDENTVNIIKIICTKKENN